MVTSLLPLFVIKVSVFYRFGVIIPDVAFVYLAYSILSHADTEGALRVKKTGAHGDAHRAHRLHRGRVLECVVGEVQAEEARQLIGNEEARLALSVWLEEVEARSQGALLVGPPGTGKTTFVTPSREGESG